MNPVPTKMAVIDPLRACPLRCRGCYYLHGDMSSVKPISTILNDIDLAISRGNTAIQVTGGEPLIYPYLKEMVEYAKRLNLGVSIISSCFCDIEKVKPSFSFIDNFLISIHGLEKTHNEYVQNDDARRKQIEFLTYIKRNTDIIVNFNFVINRYNQSEMLEVAKWMVQWHPSIVNFINMNPHGEWGHKKEETKSVIADLRLVEPILNSTIEYLESYGIGVNVRYYPMCRVKEEYRRCICNDRHVVFDPYEWDYNIVPKTFEAFNEWGTITSRNIEHKDDCRSCDLQNICGGINKAFHIASDRKMIDPIKDFSGDRNNFYFYRQHAKTLERFF